MDIIYDACSYLEQIDVDISCDDSCVQGMFDWYNFVGAFGHIFTMRRACFKQTFIGRPIDRIGKDIGWSNLIRM